MDRGPGRYQLVDQRTDHDNRDFVIWSGQSSTLIHEVFLHDAQRSGDLLYGTVLAKHVNEQKWVVLENVTATDGSAIPQGIYTGPDIAEGDIQAGDITDLIVLVHNAEIDQNQVILEGGLTFQTKIVVSTIDQRTIRDHLRTLSIITTPTKTTSGGSN